MLRTGAWAGRGFAAISLFRAMCGRVPPYGKTATLHEMDVQILAQVKNGVALPQGAAVEQAKQALERM